MYNPAFDTFHCIYRMLNILKHFAAGECVEVDRLRIYDFYLLFPYRVNTIRLRRTEIDLKESRKKYAADLKPNPYNATTNDRRLFEQLRPYQMIALSQIASYGLINPHLLLEQKVKIVDTEKIRTLMAGMMDMPIEEHNIISWLNSSFRNTPLEGTYGLKYRTQLLEYKY